LLAGRRRSRSTCCASSMLTPGDIEAIKEWIEAFGLRPVVLPDIGDSLDGHLVDAETTPLTWAARPGEIAAHGRIAATLVIGRSLHKAADLLKQRAPACRISASITCSASTPATPSPWRWPKFPGQPVPAKHRPPARATAGRDGRHPFHDRLPARRPCRRSRSAGGLGQFLAGVGAEIVAAVARRAPRCSPTCRRPRCHRRPRGPRDRRRAARAQLMIANSHAAQTAQRLQGCRCCAPAFRSTTGSAAMRGPGSAIAARGRPCSTSPTSSWGTTMTPPVHRSIYRTGTTRCAAVAGWRWPGPPLASAGMLGSPSPATTVTVNQHFGAAVGFAIYALDGERCATGRNRRISARAHGWQRGQAAGQDRCAGRLCRRLLPGGRRLGGEAVAGRRRAAGPPRRRGRDRPC
jgi:hypothetical protein